MRLGRFRFGHPRELSRVSGRVLGVGIAGMAASAVALVSVSGGTPASSSDPESPGGRLIEAAFETLYSDIGEYGALVNSQTLRVRLASLHMHFTVDAAPADNEQTTAPVPATDRASFDERFNSSDRERLSSFDERFASATEGNRELPPRSVQRPGWLAAAELPLETPKRQDARLAMPAPADDAAAVTKGSVGAAPNKPMRLAYAPSDAPLGDRGNRTAIYDISARAVYLPNGEKLEAHSGFGEHMDDPRSVGIRMRGVTPPNVYALSLRERLFHGDRAIRLTPVEPDKMFGRNGFLAHSYLLGPNGQSNGCVSISNYPKFLNAFLNGEIDRLVVVERLADPPPAPEIDVGWLSERLKAFFRSS
jgi:hypothetical protein